LRLEDPRAALSSGKFKGKLEFYTQDSARTLKVEGLEVPIEYETTPALALTLEGAPVWDFEIAGFRSGDFTIAGANLREGLFMFQPHKTGRVPVVLVHGTASSPARWAELVNELHNDHRFWENYEIWLFMYNTGNPVAYSAMLLREALTRALKDLDPGGNDRGLQQMVVIGHSQGGLLTKMTVIDSGTDLWPFKVPPEELDLDAEDRELLTNSLLIKPLPFVRRVVFIATPHRGSYQALGLLGNFASWLVNMPGRLTKLSLTALTLQRKGLLLGPTTGVPTSIDNMNPNNRFIRALSEIHIADDVAAHSIVGVEGSGAPAEGGDGVVKYSSAHIDGVVSEKIVRSGHSMQGNPETIQEVKRILMEHAQAAASSNDVGVAASAQ
jgi:pimeloyl-ACP methyl ester carboxylesterase